MKYYAIVDELGTVQSIGQNDKVKSPLRAVAIDGDHAVMVAQGTWHNIGTNFIDGPAITWGEVRTYRNAHLYATDWVEPPDKKGNFWGTKRNTAKVATNKVEANKVVSNKARLIKQRQALRDLPQTCKDDIKKAWFYLESLERPLGSAPFFQNVKSL